MQTRKPLKLLLFKSIVIGVYLAFFAVQLGFQCDILLLGNRFQSVVTAQATHTSPVIKGVKDSKGLLNIKLNKRYHPESFFEVFAAYPEMIFIYPVLKEQAVPFVPVLTHVWLSQSPQRGPPAAC